MHHVLVNMSTENGQAPRSDIRPTFVNVTSSRGVSAVGIQVLSSSATGISNGVLQTGYQSQPESCTRHMPQDTYGYKVKIFNPKKRSKFIVRQLHHFDGRFMSVNSIKQAFSDELGEEVPDVDSDYSVGYFEGRHQKKRWLANGEDLAIMYQIFKPGSEVFLWCDGRDEDSQISSRNNSQTSSRNNSQESSVNKRQAREEELDTVVKELKEKHEDNYTTPQLRLWARMIVSGTHDDMDDPPRVPMIIGAPMPKKQKQNSMTSALVDAATAFAKVLSPSVPHNCSSVEPVTSAVTPVSSTKSCRSGVSPGKLADVRMKNLEQLRCMQKLMEDGILSQEEFREQKEIIMNILRDL